MLPPQNRAFQRPADFDDLKSMRNRLKTEVVFIAPSGPGPGEFARQRRFPVYSSLQSYAQALHEESSLEAAPKKGLFGGPKSKTAEMPPPSPAPVIPAAEQTEHNGTGYPAAPFVGGLVAGGAGALAANHLLHPDHNAGSVSPVPPGAEDDYQFAPDAAVPPAAPRSPLPPLARVPDAPTGRNSSQPASNEATPKQPRITSDLARAAPSAPVPPLQAAPVNRASRQPNSGKMDALGAGMVGAVGGVVAGRATTGGGAPPIIRGTPSGTKRSGGPGRRRRLGWLIVLALLLLSLLLCSGVAFAFPKQTQAVTSNLTRMMSNLIHPQTSSSSPMVTITPASQVVENPYSIQAVTTGASATQHQVTARLLTANPSQKKTVTATGHVTVNPAPAKGVVTFFNGSSAPYVYGTTTPIVGNGVTFYLDAPVTIPPANLPNVGMATGTVTASTPGSNGNIGPGVINIQGQFITITNKAAFTGGQDAKNYHFLQQSDFDSVAGPLKTTVLSQAKSALQSQISSTERVARALQCTSPTATADQPIGDKGVDVTSATVTASASCSEEVYDQQGLQGLVEGLLKAKAGADPKLTGYALVGSIVTDTKVQGVDSNNTVTLAVTAKGKWVYQVDKNAIARLLAGLSAEQASAKLKSQPGIANFSLASGITTFPSNPAQISIEVVNVPGFSGGGETGTPVPGTPSSSLTPQPGNG